MVPKTYPPNTDYVALRGYVFPLRREPEGERLC